jgi:hypothetical protein
LFLGALLLLLLFKLQLTLLVDLTCPQAALPTCKIHETFA